MNTPVTGRRLVPMLCAVGAMFSSGFAGSAQALDNPRRDAESPEARIVGHVLRPAHSERSPADIAAQLEVPDGFKVDVFASGLGNPRILVFGDEGRLYVSRRESGDVVMLRDADGDGRADAAPQVVAEQEDLHGIAIHDGMMYLSAIRKLWRAPINDDGTLGSLELLHDDLPDAGQHPNRTLLVGPDEMLYLSVGSTCNACAEDNPENATMVRMALDGSGRSVYASGLRNTIGFAFHPESGALYGMDHGIDWLGDNAQGEELNRIEPDARYGWPYVFGPGRANPADPPPDGQSH